MPPHHGLYASVLAPIAAAFFASSKFLQTGPTAVTSLLAFGALTPLATAGSDAFVAAAALLALLVGVVRVVLGLLKGGAFAVFLSPPVIRGFTVGAGLLILLSQLPTLLGAPRAAGGVLTRAWTAISDPALWSTEAIVLGLATVAIVRLGRRIHGMFPGVLVAAVAGIVYAESAGYLGATLGSVPDGFISLQLDLPWASIPALIVPAIVLAILGFAEPTAIARTYAAQDREVWNPNRELVSQGVANLASGAIGGFPVGGSFSRSALSRLAGAKTRWAGAFTGLIVMAMLPFASVLSPLPKAVLAGIIIAAVINLLRFGALLEIMRSSRPQGVLAVATLVLTIALSPHVEYAVLAGLGMSLGVHAWREMRITLETHYADGVLTLEPQGVLWFASADGIERTWLACLVQHPEAHTLAIDLGGLGRIDYTGAMALKTMTDRVEAAGIEVEWLDVPPQTERILSKVSPDMVPGAES